MQHATRRRSGPVLPRRWDVGCDVSDKGVEVVEQVSEGVGLSNSIGFIGGGRSSIKGQCSAATQR